MAWRHNYNEVRPNGHIASALAMRLSELSWQVSVGRTRVNVLNLFYAARTATIYGGNNEIQRNTVAKAVLGLPD